MGSEKLTPMMRQYMSIKTDYPDGILFFRMGDFYEVFHEDAKICSRILGLALTCRNKKSDNPVPMAGLPHHASQGYIKRLVEAGQKVIICDQIEDPTAAVGIVKRGVTRVITPGTILEDDMLEAKSNNFIAALFEGGINAGLAYADISTGEFYLEEIQLEKINDALARISPSEILISDEASSANLNNQKYMLSRRSKFDFELQSATEKIKNLLGVKTLQAFGIENMTDAIKAAGALSIYISETQRKNIKQITNIQAVQSNDFLIIDEASQLNLELVRTARERNENGSLVDVMDKTSTAMGARLLRNWIRRPLINATHINARLNAVQELLEKNNTLLSLIAELKEIGDLQRLSAKIANEKANARDLIAIAKTCSHIPKLKSILKDFQSAQICDSANKMEELTPLTNPIINALVEEPPITIGDGNLFKAKFNQELDELREIAKGGKNWIAQFQKCEAERTGITSLKIGYNRVFGYYIEITNMHKDKVPENYIRKQTLTNAERYITDELKNYESKVLGAEEKIKKLEFDLFIQLRASLTPHVNTMQQVASAIAKLDCFCSLAIYASEMNHCRPIVDESLNLKVIDGRHPVIESISIGEKFVPNDNNLDYQTRMVILTGPNMSGKSTYIRQSALIILMAQMGAYVPAKSAHIGVVDRIFTRIGASDELSKGQSTFMVEMVETASILHNASERSFVVLDEVGRGTSTFDGLSIAWAISEHLCNTIKARTLFATHYHELTELADMFASAVNANVSVKEWNGEVIFMHKIIAGRADKSYGIHVAKLAGVPKEITDRANEILQNLEANELDLDNKPKLAKGKNLNKTNNSQKQLSLFNLNQTSKIEEAIKQIDINNLSPMQALLKLQELQQSIK